MKTPRSCRGCGTELVLGQNWSAGQAKSYNYLCRACMSAVGSAWHAANKERAADLRRAREATNPEQAAARKREYYHAHRQKFRAAWHASEIRRKAADDGVEPPVEALTRHPLAGRPQTPEHIAKRRAAAARTIANAQRTCRKCGGIFTPTQAAQVYCSGQCWNSVASTKRRQPPRIAVSPTKYAALLETYGARCQICQLEQRGNARRDRLAGDHDHETGAIRGLLCHRCNTAIGLLNDSPDLAHQAFRYLAYHGAGRRKETLRMTSNVSGT